MTKRLEGKRCVITGAGSGIGRASAERFAAEGASVLVVGRRPENTNETVSLVRSAGGSAFAMVTDATTEENVQAIVEQAKRDLGGLDVFFANVALPGAYKAFFEQSVDEWMEIWRVNVVSCYLAVKYAGQHMREHGGGSIILTSSAASLRANAGDIPYSATKAGVNSLAQGAANVFAGTGVRVNALLPGLVETKMTSPMFEAARARGVEQKIGSVTPMRRAGQPHEIAAMAAFLASDDSSFVTGQLYAVDGGLSSTHPGRFNM